MAIFDALKISEKYKDIQIWNFICEMPKVSDITVSLNINKCYAECALYQDAGNIDMIVHPT